MSARASSEMPETRKSVAKFESTWMAISALKNILSPGAISPRPQRRDSAKVVTMPIPSATARMTLLIS